MINFFNIQLYGNSVFAYLRFLVLFCLAVIFIRYFKKSILNFFQNWSEKNAIFLNNIFLKNIRDNLIVPAYYLAFLLSIKSLALPVFIQKGSNMMAVLIFTYFGIRFSIGLLLPLIELIISKRPTGFNNKHTLKVVNTLVKILLWTIAAIVLLDNLGIKVSALITGLGIGGIAIALATQSILGDLFSYFIIFFDRPFELGDFIIVGDFMGTVENIGIKTTRIRSLGGEEIVFSNTDLTSSRVRNYKRMNLRRIVFKFGVVYQTATEILKEIPKIIEKIIKEIKDTTFDRTHFAGFGAYSLDFEVVYYVLSNDYNKYMDIQQEINLKIKEEFAERNIEFAYPTQSLFISQEQSKS